jgi:hypothetical protein
MTVLHQLSESIFLTGTSGPVVRQALGEPLQLGRNGRVEVVA